MWDAVVIGGGPAGSVCATLLARHGRKVLLLERERFPREHIGESLLPGVLPYLDAIGARSAVERAGFERKEGQTFVWGEDRAPWSIDFRELDEHPYAFFVDRARFDAILLERAREVGVTVEEGRTVRRLLGSERVAGVVDQGEDGALREVAARFVVDCSGQSALVARGEGLRCVERGLKNVAIWAYFEGVSRLPGDRRAHILTVSIPDGWIWVIPLGERTSIGVVTSGGTREAREALGAEAWYEQTLASTAEVAALLGDARRATSVRAAKDWSYRAKRLAGPGLFLAGDAACFIDPILSTGVHLAMTSAFWAASAVYSSLREPKGEALFRRFYATTYGHAYSELLAQVKAFYRAEGRRDSIFWAAKSVLRVGTAVRADRAFLFITAGLLRNAALPAPHEPLAQATRALGEAKVALPLHADGLGVSPPLLVHRADGATELVSFELHGLRLVPRRHTPKGLLDRAPGTFFALELADAARAPLALAIVERVEGETWRAKVHAYPVRPRDEGVLRAIERALEGSLERGSLAHVRSKLRAALRVPGRLPEGVRAVRSRELLGGGLVEPPLTAVLEPREASSGLPRVYLVAEARLPLEMTEVPRLRTRFLDVTLRPRKTKDLRVVEEIDEVRAWVLPLLDRLFSELVSATEKRDAFEIAARTIEAAELGDYALVACGRLGRVADD